MFSLSIRRVLTICDKTIVRSLRGGGRLGPGTGSNPGLNSRLKAFNKEGVKIDDEDAEEFVESSASDFFAAGDAMKANKEDLHRSSNNLRHQIIKEKYFKESLPNLLTWSEKDQIRHLHDEHPDEWTVERIAESFPVTADVAKKLLKYPWKPSTEQRIARHDASAVRNWKELKEGTLNIPHQLRQHFLKFTNRNIPPLKTSSKIDLTQEDDIGEFQQIVDRCAAKENSQQNMQQEFNEEDTDRFTNQKKDYKRVTLQELKDRIQSRLDSGTEVAEPDQIIANHVKPNHATVPSKKVEFSQIESDKPEEKALGHFKEDPVTVTSYPERIRIPKQAYRRDATYKVNDCYYDHDGRFLYRVLGLTNK